MTAARLFLCLVALSSWTLTAAAQDTASPAAGETVAGLADVPLMPGLEEQAGSTVVFDKPEGRIVIAVAEGAVPVAAVRSYYESALTMRGWRALPPQFGAVSYARGGEVLEITIEPSDPGADTVPLAEAVGARVSFWLSPS